MCHTCFVVNLYIMVYSCADDRFLFLRIQQVVPKAPLESAPSEILKVHICSSFPITRSHADTHIQGFNSLKEVIAHKNRPFPTGCVTCWIRKGYTSQLVCDPLPTHRPKQHFWKFLLNFVCWLQAKPRCSTNQKNLRIIKLKYQTHWPCCLRGNVKCHIWASMFLVWTSPSTCSLLQALGQTNTRPKLKRTQFFFWTYACKVLSMRKLQRSKFKTKDVCGLSCPAGDTAHFEVFLCLNLLGVKFTEVNFHGQWEYLSHVFCDTNVSPFCRVASECIPTIKKAKWAIFCLL